MADEIRPVGAPDGSRLSSNVDERKFLNSLDKNDDKKKEETSNEPDEDDKEDTTGEEESESVDDDTEDSTSNEEDDTENLDEDEEESTEEEDTTDIDDADEDTSLYKQLKKSDAKIFTKIPELRQVIFREQEFTKLFPTVDEAKLANDKASTFDAMQDDILSGKAETFIGALKNSSVESLKEFSASFINDLHKVDKDVFLEIISPVLKNVLRNAARNSNENIKNSAHNINQWLFEDGDVNKDSGFTPKDKKQEDSVTKREREFESKQLNNFIQDASSVAQRALKKQISKSLEALELNSWTVNKMTDDIYTKVVESMDKDVRYSGQIKALIGKAKASGFPTSAKDSIISTFLSRGKAGIQKYRQQVLSEAKVSAKNVSDKNNKRPIRVPSNNSAGRNSTTSFSPVKGKQVDWNKTSERDMLDGKMTLKK